MTNSINLYDQLATAFAAEIEEFNYAIFRNDIELRNDSDGAGDYIAKWDYSKPIPAGLKLGK